MKKKIIILFTFLLIFTCFINTDAKVSNEPVKNYANVIFFVYYEGQNDTLEYDYFADNTDNFLNVYNGSSKRSFTNYLNQISYGKLNVKNIFPQIKNGKIDALKISSNIEDAYRRNDDGTIFNAILNEYRDSISDIIDYNNDGLIDNVTIIVKSRDVGFDAQTQSTFVSHKSDYGIPNNKLYGKSIGTYNVVSTDSAYSKVLNSFVASTLAHEFLHSLGYSDLYRNGSSYEFTYPVYSWDIMANAEPRMNYPLAYNRYYFTHWLDIDTITSSQTNLRLDVQSNKDGNQAYILKSPLNDRELFVVEYRKKGNLYNEELDGGILSSGVIVYRVDLNVEKLSNYHGKTGIFVFRPNMTNDEVNDVLNASLSGNAPMQSINNRINSIGTADMDATLRDGALTFSDGTNSGIVIKNVSVTGGDYMTLDVDIPSQEDFDLWTNTNLPDKSNNSTSSKNIAITNYNDSIYSLFITQNKIYTQVYNGTIWQTLGSPLNVNIDTSSQARMFTINNELYFIARTNNSLVIYKWNKNNNTWNLFSSLSEIINEFDITVVNNKLYILTTTSGSGSNANANIYTLNNNTITKDATIDVGLSGIPKIANIGSTIYFGVKKGNNEILLYKYQNNYISSITCNIRGNSYDLKSINNKIYIVSGEEATPATISIYDGNTFKSINSSFGLFSPSLITNQGNLYIYGTRDEKIYMYHYKEDTSSFTLEGNAIDSGSSTPQIQIASINDTIYASIKRNDNEVLVKEKKTVNKLLSITVTPPTKLTYNKNETINTSGLKVIANYKNYSKEVTNYTLTNFNTSKSGSFNATVTYEGFVSVFNYQVKETTTTKPTTKAPSYKIISDGVYLIRSSVNKDMVLDVYAGLNSSGTNVQLYKFNNTRAQKWKFRHLGNGYYEVTSLLSSNLSLNLNGTNININNKNNKDTQKWILKDSGSNTFNIVSKSSGKNIDIAGGKIKNGTNIQVYKSNTSNAQKFILEKVSSRIENGTYVIRSAVNNNKVLDVEGAKKKNGANVHLYEFYNSNNQKWKFKHIGNGYYEIKSIMSTKYSLDVAGASTKNKANIQIYKANNTDAQKWLIKDAGNGYYYIIAKNSGKYVDIKSGKVKNRSNIQLYKGNGSNAQKFTLEKV